MNTDRLIKILEWRTSITVSSNGTFKPQNRKEIDECIMDVFNQFYEFKKKKYELTLDTSLDTDKLEDMDIAILICEIECGFGLNPIPSDDLRTMSTFENVADYVNNNLPIHSNNGKSLDKNVDQRMKKMKRN